MNDLLVCYVIVGGTALVRSNRISINQPKRRGNKTPRLRRDYDEIVRLSQAGVDMHPAIEQSELERRRLDSSLVEKRAITQNGEFERINVDGRGPEDFNVRGDRPDGLDPERCYGDGSGNSWKYHSRSCKQWAVHKRRPLRRNVDKVEATFAWHERELRQMDEDDLIDFLLRREDADREVAESVDQRGRIVVERIAA